MKKTKTQKGITLVALIITIVVLLILAVVAIGAVRESNIINHAQNAGNDYTIAQEKEQIGLALSEWQIQKNISGNTKKFKTVIEDALAGVAEVVSGAEDGPVIVEFKKTGNRYEVKSNGEIESVTVSAAQPVVQTAKAFTVQDEVIGVISPDGTELAVFTSSSPMPYMTGIEIENTSSLESNNIYITIDSGIDYQKLLYVETNKAVAAITTDGAGIYFGTGSTGEDGKVTISVTTSGYLAFDDSIDVSQYYHEDVYYYMPAYTEESGATRTESIYSLANEKMYGTEQNMWYSVTVVDKGVVSSEETITVQVDGSEITIREGAQKLEIALSTTYSMDAYLQDGNLYCYSGYGTPTKFLNIAALPAE